MNGLNLAIAAKMRELYGFPVISRRKKAAPEPARVIATQPATAPVLVGPDNAVAALGVRWRRVREAAARAGLRAVVIGKAHCYRVADIVRVLTEEEPALPEPQVALQALREELRARSEASDRRRRT